MYYYKLKCVLYTPERLNLPNDFFGLFPAINLQTTSYLSNYKHNNNAKAPPLRRRSSQPPQSTQKHVPPTPIHNVKPHSSHSLEDQIDFRFGPIEMTAMDVSAHNTKKKKKRMDESTHQLGYGVMHLYRGLRPLTEQELPDTKLAKDQSLNLPTSGQDEDTTLCVLAVPSYMTFKDFTDFLGSANSQIEHYRFIRDFSPNKYTALLKFRDRQSAFACYQKFNGRRFNMTEPEISHVVYLESNTVESVTIAPQSYPYLNETLSQDLAHKTQDMAELPTCPVCLERMDESITGLQHIQCHHTTQCYCIDKWGHNQCPVCRYSQRPVLSASSAKKNTHYEYEQIQCECFECSSTESLWICMVCGHVGCGRYQEAHAYDHFMETNHLYALEIETQRVWDYLGDGYVHRLIQNTVDGAIVELPSRSENSSAATEDSGHMKRLQSSMMRLDIGSGSSGDGSGGAGAGGFGSSGSGSADNLGAQGSHQQGKLDSISVDYTYMLTSQLDSQRMYYEEQLDALTEELSNLTSQVSTISQEIEAAKRHKTELIDKGRSLDSAIVDVKKEKEKADKRALSYKDKYEAMQKNLNEEKLLTKSLIRNNELLKKDADDKDATLKVLGDQVRDLMFFLEARDKVKEGSHDKSNDENAA
ncbi:hypothetical protein V8B55DRAFT_1472498 [Mucor lusitanicus]|uniref:BRCA1-associated protein n=1 Tax=Mucor circinelloides f. lusitanicus TaxID=29924 RepID=A0A8H4BGI6_MUCCL|nr:hypothetical protein FB192DRAFT_1373751 [Mucor lusitanicus]